MIEPTEFLEIVNTKKTNPVFKIGTIPSDYVSGRPQIIFDGETTASSRTYPYLYSYTPAADDRVLIAIVGHSGVVLGKIV